MTSLPVSPIAGLRTVELTLPRAPLLQQFFEANEDYFLATSGQAAGPSEAVDEITSQVPAGWAYTSKLVLGYVDDQGTLAAMANVISDLLAASVFHMATFIVATNRHGRGDAQQLYQSLENWCRCNGAAWMRLGVVCGHARAERFWLSQGYIPVRRRDSIEMGSRMVSVQTMIKPLNGESVERYLSLVERDRLGDGAVPTESA